MNPSALALRLFWRMRTWFALLGAVYTAGLPIYATSGSLTLVVKGKFFDFVAPSTPTRFVFFVMFGLADVGDFFALTRHLPLTMC